MMLTTMTMTITMMAMAMTMMMPTRSNPCEPHVWVAVTSWSKIHAKHMHCVHHTFMTICVLNVCEICTGDVVIWFKLWHQSPATEWPIRKRVTSWLPPQKSLRLRARNQHEMYTYCKTPCRLSFELCPGHHTCYLKSALTQKNKRAHLFLHTLLVKMVVTFQIFQADVRIMIYVTIT